MSTITSSLPLVHASLPNRAAAPTAPAAAPATPAAAPEDKNDITIAQALEGIGSAVVVAGIETVGNTASSLIHAPEALARSYKALYKTDMIGPVLKTAIAVILPPCAVAAPILTAIGSAGFGLFRGFSESVEHGMSKAIDTAVSDVKFFHKDLAGKLMDGIQEFEQPHLEPGQQPYDIKVLEAGKGLVGAAAAGAVEGAGVGLITLARTPKGTVRAFQEIWKSDQGPVLKTCESLLVPPAAVLAAPLGLVGGAVYGIVTGFKDGYQKGIGEAVSKSVQVVQDYNKATAEALRDRD